jgi:hypothetical protein
MDCSADGADATAGYPLNGRLRLVTTKATRRPPQFEQRQRSSSQRHVASAIGDQRLRIRVPVPQTPATRQQDRDMHAAPGAPNVALAARARLPGPRAISDPRQASACGPGGELARPVGVGLSSRQPQRSWQRDAWAFRAARPVRRPVGDRLPAGDIVADQRDGLVVRHPADEGAGPVADHWLGLRATPEADQSAVARGGVDREAGGHLRRIWSAGLASVESCVLVRDRMMKIVVWRNSQRSASSACNLPSVTEAGGGEPKWHR